MKEAVFSSPFFGITLSIAGYAIGVWANRKTRLAAVNPLLVAYVIVIGFLLLFDIPLSWYDEGGDIISMFLSPATAALALSVYRQRALVKKHLAAVLAGCAAGVASSLLCVWGMCKLLGLDVALTASLLPKSITTPMAIAVSESLGGIQAITIVAVIFTGVLGAVIGPFLIKLFRVKDETAQGLAMGAASHAVGTGKALELGEAQGAMSSVALTVSGVITVLVGIVLSVL